METTINKMKVIWMITERGDRSYWTKIGVGFVNRDGSINLQLDALPCGAAKVQLRDFTQRDAEQGELTPGPVAAEPSTSETRPRKTSRGPLAAEAGM